MSFNRHGRVPTCAADWVTVAVATAGTYLSLPLCAGQVHLLEHLGPLLHHQRLLVGES